jgi:cell division protein FtsB
MWLNNGEKIMIKTMIEDLKFGIVNNTILVLAIIGVLIWQGISIHQLHKENVAIKQEMSLLTHSVAQQEVKQHEFALQIDTQLSNLSLKLVEIQNQVVQQKIQIAKLQKQNHQFKAKLAKLHHHIHKLEYDYKGVS